MTINLSFFRMCADERRIWNYIGVENEISHVKEEKYNSR